MELTETEKAYYRGQAEGLFNELIKEDYISMNYIREKVIKLQGLLLK